MFMTVSLTHIYLDIIKSCSQSKEKRFKRLNYTRNVVFKKHFRISHRYRFQKSFRHVSYLISNFSNIFLDNPRTNETQLLKRRVISKS